MSVAKVAISLDKQLLVQLDNLVAEKRFPSRSRAIQDAITEMLARMERTRLARELAKLDVEFEQELADEGLTEDLSAWPAY